MTVMRGNCSFGMFSNYPENVDDALRQRAGARWLVDGPQTRDDYIDIFVLLAGKNHKIDLGDHELYAAQEIQRAVSEATSPSPSRTRTGCCRSTNASPSSRASRRRWPTSAPTCT